MLGCLLTPCTATVLQPVWPKGLSAWLFDLKYIPLGVSNAIWSGLGMVG
jgi:multidrug transporter EmrE-like cation transporter